MDDQELIQGLRENRRSALEQAMERYAGYAAAVLGGRWELGRLGRIWRSCSLTYSCLCGATGWIWTRKNP